MSIERGLLLRSCSLTRTPLSFILVLCDTNMRKITQTPEKIKQILEEIHAVIVESEFTSRWALVEGYHKVGELIEKNKLSDLTEVAEYVGRSERTIYRCKQFYKKYPALNLLPEGKNTSWNQIVTKYLSDPRKQKEMPMIECPMCKYKWQR